MSGLLKNILRWVFSSMVALVSLGAFASWSHLDGHAQETLPHPSSSRAQGDANETTSIYLPTPFRSVRQAQTVLDNLAMKIRLNMGYQACGAEEGVAQTDNLPGVRDSRCLIVRNGDTYRTVELAVAAHPKGNLEFVLYGRRWVGANGGPNADLAEVRNLAEGLLQEAPDLDLRQLSVEIYHLSYLHSDRALALLKTLGYTTIEYNADSGDNLYEKVYRPLQQGDGSLPVVVKLIDSTKTSLMDPPPSGGGFGSSSGGSTTDLGGIFLHQMTSGEPQQRLLLLYDEQDPSTLARLLNLLRDKIDVSAPQIVIEALVIELNSDRLRDLGISFQSTQHKIETSLLQQEGDRTTPFIFQFDRNAAQLFTFKAKLEALLETGEAEILSSPSVLVLDGRQARIQIGQRIPTVNSTSTASATYSSINYETVGIVLNLRPRVSEDGSEVTLQAETIVSSVNQFATSQAGQAAEVFLAPVIDNRQVQTIVRVANDSPFIIGGLVSMEDRSRRTGIPLLSEIPVIGFLFGRNTTEKIKKEVIVVLTPHVVPVEEKTFSYVQPKDSELFDSFGYQLFRNAYRIRRDDIFDLGFVYESNILMDLVARVRAAAATNPTLQRTEPFASILRGGVPGEEILVRRMLWEIIDKLQYGRHVDPTRVIYFETDPTAADGSGFRLAFLRDKLGPVDQERQTLLLSFEAQPRGTPQHPFVQPVARASYETVAAGSYPGRLAELNARAADGSPRQWVVMLGQDFSGIRVPPLDLLRDILVMQRVLDLNSSLPLTLDGFHAGREIIFPDEEDLKRRFHVIDRHTARLFFEVVNYYPAFEQEFNRRTRESLQQIAAPPER